MVRTQRVITDAEYPFTLHMVAPGHNAAVTDELRERLLERLEQDEFGLNREGDSHGGRILIQATCRLEVGGYAQTVFNGFARARSDPRHGW